MFTGVMIAAMLFWFQAYSKTMDSDDFLYLFGRRLPSIALMVTMIFRFVPQFHRRLQEIAAVQKTLGVSAGQGSLRQRLRAGGALLSALVSVTLEDSLQTADSMNSRGYGLGRKTRARQIRFTLRDGLLLEAPWRSWCFFSSFGFWAGLIISIFLLCQDQNGRRRPRPFHRDRPFFLIPIFYFYRGGNPMALFEIENLSFAYPKAEEPAIKEVSFSLEQGEFFLLSRASGCGKTTLLRQLKPAIALWKKAGDNLYEGRPLESLDQRRAALEIGFVFQSPDAQIVTDRVASELAFGLKTPAWRRRKSAAGWRRWRAFSALKAGIIREIKALSGGKSRRLIWRRCW